MWRIIYSADARDDLDDIYNYTLDQWDERQADAYASGIRTAIERLRDFAKIGTPVRSASGEVHRLRYKSHAVIYRHDSGNEVRILRVLHARRRLTSEVLTESDPNS